VLGKPVIVENRPGASGMIAGEIVAKSLPDGYTLFISSTGVMTNLPALRKSMPYDVLRDFVAVARVAVVPLVLEVHPSVPAKTTRQFVALAHSQPGRLLIASSGFRGSAPALVALISGEVDSYLDQLTSSLPYIKAGRIRAIAATTARRAMLLPEVPTLAESGVPGFEASTVTGVYAPAATPAAIVERLNKVVSEILRSNAVRQRFSAIGAEASPGTSEEFAAFVRNDIARWKKVVKDAGIPLIE
jgi:tripartite-type tricarboxylate transporter receptor subunit TctC